MNRRSFLKFLGIGAATAAVATNVLMAEPKKHGWYADPTSIKSRKMIHKYIESLNEYPKDGQYFVGLDMRDHGRFHRAVWATLKDGAIIDVRSI